jgi:DNA-binding NarL/FixJ family response regulator
VLVDGSDNPAAALDLAQRLWQQQSDVPVIIVEGARGSADPREAVAAGVAGVVSAKLAEQPERLVGAIQVVAAGGYVSAGARAGELARGLRRAKPAGAHGLTEREMQVLTLVAEGLSNRKIADELSIAEQSAKNHVSNLLRKMNVPNRTAAAAMARRDGLVP